MRPIIRTITVAVAATALALALTGCASSEMPAAGDEQQEASQMAPHAASGLPARFQAVDADMDDVPGAIDAPFIVVDRETGVEYLYLWNHGGYSGGSAMVMLVNADGTPKVDGEWAAEH